MNLLSIGGSDPSSGAGIQSDVKAFSSLEMYGLTVLTTITSQNTSRFGLIHPIPKKILKNQLDFVFSDFTIDGIKIGMVYDSEIIKIIHNKIKKLSIPIVVDPIIKSTTGKMLIKKSAVNDLKNYLFPLATAVTPNKFEAEFITGKKITNKESLKKVAEKIREMGPKNVVITGVELKKKYISDFLLAEKIYVFNRRKLKTVSHGSGCNYSSSLLTFMAQGKSISDSVKLAQNFAWESIKNSQKLGKGVTIAQRKKNTLFSELSEAINNFSKIRGISKEIPECQTNFVFSKKYPRTLKDILGISGRIVKTGDSVTKIGNLEYGGSKHVAAATLEMNKKFPQIRSAINVKFQKRTITNLEKNGFIVASYDRAKEPKSIKSKDGHSIKWGVKNVLKDFKTPPDAIFHKGYFGKEPMIIIFGTTPKVVLDKVSKIFIN